MTKRTYKRNVIKFSKIKSKIFDDLMKSIESGLKGKSQKFIDNYTDRILKLVDQQSQLNIDIVDYCLKNNIDRNEFMTDVINDGHTISYDRVHGVPTKLPSGGYIVVSPQTGEIYTDGHIYSAKSDAIKYVHEVHPKVVIY